MQLFTKRVITDLARTTPYLIRWSLWLPFGMSLKLHQIVRPDDDRCAHDHPWWFVRIILWGGYTEACGEENRVEHRKPWRIYFCPTGFRHRILTLPNGESWSLVLCGPRSQRWGFFTNQGWMHWKSFVDAAWSKRVLWCDDGRTLNDEGKES